MIDPRDLVSAPVVVGVDGSEAADLAVVWAAEMAAHRGRELRIVHGLDFDATQTAFGAPRVIDTIRQHGIRAATSARRLAHAVAADLRISTEISAANPATLLIDQSRTAHLVVLGASGDRHTRPHIGATLLAVAAHAHGAVVVIRDTGTEQRIRHTGPVVVGVDGSPVSEAAIETAFEEAALRDCGLVAVHTWSDLYFGRYAGRVNALIPAADLDTAEQALLAERLAGWQEKYPDVTVTRKVYLSGPAANLHGWSRTAQLVVVGTRGRGGFAGLLLGSTSSFLVQHAHCPVMVVPPAAL